MRYILKSKHFVILLLIISVSMFKALEEDVFAESPSFTRQEITDSHRDWQLWNQPSSNTFGVPTHNGHSISVNAATDISECKIDNDSNNQFVHSDIESVSYISDGKVLNATIWLTSPFKEPPLNDTIDIFQEELQLKVSDTNETLEEYITSNTASIFDIILDPLTTQNSTSLVGSPALNVTYPVRIGQNEQIQKTQLWSVDDNNNKAYNITYSVLSTNYTTYTNYLMKIKKMIESFEIGDSNDDKFDKNQSSNTPDNFLIYEGNSIRMPYPADWIEQEYNDGKSITITFRSPFKDEKLREPSWHEIFYTLALDIDSVHDVGTDYRIKFSRIPNDTWTGYWTKQVQEVSANDKTRVLQQQTNYTAFYDKEGSYILFSFNLDNANFPKQYNAVLYTTDHFVINHKFCRLVDMTNWVIIPPPVFGLSTKPSYLELRPGEEKTIEIQLTGNTNLQSEAVLTTRSMDKDIEVKGLHPLKMSIPSLGNGTSRLYLKVSESAEDKPSYTSYTIPITSNISFPTIVKGGETSRIEKGEIIDVSSNIIITVLPPYSFEQKLTNFTNTYITPISGIWTFLAGVGAVVTPLIIRAYNNRKRNKYNENIY